MIQRAMPELPWTTPSSQLCFPTRTWRDSLMSARRASASGPDLVPARDGAIVAITGPKAEKARALAANGACA
jgi:hypothetical protein